MKRLVFSFVLGATASLTMGCGGAVEEIPASSEAGPEMADEEVENYMKESMERGKASEEASK
ncbi:MAG: hypothetical protein ABGZ53_34805 [Fuerstiella sp.]